MLCLCVLQLYKRSLSDTPYFSIAVQVKDGRFPVERPVFLDTSEQKMLYNPEVGTDLPMGNLSSKCTVFDCNVAYCLCSVRTCTTVPMHTVPDPTVLY